MTDHIRIDEGLKRRPRTRRSRAPANGSPQAVRAGNAHRIADLVPEAVLNRYLEEPIHEIAASYGLSEARLYRWLLDTCEADWRKAQVAKATAALDRAKADIDNAQDPMQLAKAREKLKAAQWDLERLLPRVFGLKQEVKLDFPDRGREIEESLADRALELLKHIRGVATEAPENQPAALPDLAAEGPNGSNPA